MTDLDVYQPAAPGQYQAGIVMDEKAAKALDDQVRRCTEAVLRENTDYGVIPGTNGQKTLWRPGAQKLLQWFGLSCTCERVEIERDDDGRKHGITYRATVTRRLPDGTPWILATCEGTADYDESKFYQTAEEVQRKAKDRETRNAETYRRPRNPEKWQGLGEYRADWNALMKRAQKRAIVGAVVDATAAGGIFTDREEDDHTPPPADDGPSWYEQALEHALTFTDKNAGRQLYVEAAQAHRDGLINRRQQDHLQNTVKQRAKLLETATPVDVEDLAKAAQDSPQTVRGTAAAGDSTRGQHRDQAPRTAEKHGADPVPAAAGDAPSRSAQPLPPLPGEDEPTDVGAEAPDSNETTGPVEPLAPGEAAEYGTERHRKVVGIVWQHLQRLGYPDDKHETDEEKAKRLADTAKLAGVSEITSTNDLDLGELAAVADTLARCKDRDKLNALLKAGEVDG